MERSSHALAHDGKVWLIDPVAHDEALAAAERLGRIAGVIQLLDRHDRDGEALSERYRVPLHRLPDSVPDAPFELRRTVWVPRWRELRLWSPGHRALVISEAVGTASYFALGRRAGVHPMLRALPPRGVAKDRPEHLLTGHGGSLHRDAPGAIEEALAYSRRDLPRVPMAAVKAFGP